MSGRPSLRVGDRGAGHIQRREARLRGDQRGERVIDARRHHDRLARTGARASVSAIASHSKIGALQVRIVAHVGGASLQHNRAVVEHIGAAAPPPGSAPRSARPAAARCLPALMLLISANSSSTSSGESPSEGSSRMSSFGSAISPRPIASICCSPPESVPALWRCRSARRGKMPNTRSRFCARSRARAAVAAEIEVLGDRHVGEDAAAFRHMDQAARHDRGRARALDRLACEADRAAPRPQHAGDRAVERGFAGAVRAEHRDDLALVHREVDAAQDFGRAVAGVQAR